MKLIIGGGLSGRGAAKLLIKLGQRVRVSDGGHIETTRATELKELGVEVADGGHSPSHLDGIDEVIVSPGLASDHPLLTLARAKGLPLTSEIDLALGHYDGNVIAITGTNGKSTVTKMVEHLLNKLALGATSAGNIGDPPSLQIAEERTKGFMALELSSYQLADSKNLSFDACAITSLSPDHLGKHGDLKTYYGAKFKLIDRANPGARIVIGESVVGFAQRSDVELIKITSEQLKEHSWPSRVFLFRHNQVNALMATRLVEKFSDNPVPIGLLADFTPPPYRCEFVGTINGHAVINDSKSTNLASTFAALEGFKEPVNLWVGGQAKDEDFADLADLKLCSLTVFGKAGDTILKALADRELDFGINYFPTLKAACQALTAKSSKNKAAILFSPACASFDEFANFEDRGQNFNRWIENILD